MAVSAQQIGIAGIEGAAVNDAIDQCGADSWAHEIRGRVEKGKAQGIELIDSDGGRAGLAVVEAADNIFHVHALVSDNPGFEVARTFLPVAYLLARAGDCDVVTCDTERAGLAWLLKNNGFTSQRHMSGWRLERVL